jgi:hypothetical protein
MRLKSKFQLSLTLAAVLFFAGCDKISALINTFSIFPSAVAPLKIEPEVKERWTHGADRMIATLTIYKDADKSTPEKKTAAKRLLALSSAEIITQDFVATKHEAAQVWMNSIISLVRGWAGLPPPGMSMSDAAAEPKVKDITDEDVKKLKRLLENPPQ